MSTFGALLRGGLRLAWLRAPRRTPLDAGVGSYLSLWLFGLAIDAAWQWPLADAPRTFNGYGLQTSLASGLLGLVAAALLCAVAGRPRLVWTVACWSAAAWLPIAAVCGALYALAPHSDLPLAWIAFIGGLAWVTLVTLRLAAFLSGRSVARAAAATVVAVSIQVAPWLVLDAQELWVTDWDGVEFEEEFDDEPPGALDAPERTIYAQGELLARRLDRLAAQRAGVVDLYFVAFGGDAGEDVFRNEVEFGERLFAERFDARGRTLGLLNNPATAQARPLATLTNLEIALHGVASRMDVDEDILMLYLTSHGSEAHELFVNQPPLPLDQITPALLREALDDAGVRWRVVVVSSCYSGGYVDALAHPRTLVITASRADRTSFGCGADSEITWFGKAFLAEALNATADFAQAFSMARESIAGWEREGEFTASEPQMREGRLIGAKLAAWRDGLMPGDAVEFAPAKD